MLLRMKERVHVNQTARKAGAGKLNGDSGFALFVEILAREAVRSLAPAEDNPASTAVNHDVPTTKKKHSPLAPVPSAPSIHHAAKPARIQPCHPKGDHGSLPANCQGSLFD